MSTRRELAQSAGILTLAGVVVGVSNLGFNVLVARSGGAANYGVVGTLLTLTSVATFLATGTSYAVTRLTALGRVHPSTLARYAGSALWPSLVLSAGLLVTSPLLAGYLKLDSPLPVVVVALLFAGIVANAVPTGMLVGLGRFRTVAGLQLGSAAARLAAGAVLGGGRNAILGALGASVIPVIVVGPVALLLALRAPAPAPAADEPGGLGVARETITGALLAAGLWGVWSLPSVFARHQLGAVDSGNFAATQLLVGGILFMTSPLIMVFYQRVARHPEPGLVRTGLLATLGLGLVAAAGAVVLGPLVLERLYRGQFGAPAGLFAVMSASALVVAITTYAMWISRALGRQRTLMAAGIVIGLGLEALLGATWHPSALVLAVEPGLALVVALLGARVAISNGSWPRRGHAVAGGVESASAAVEGGS